MIISSPTVFRRTVRGASMIAAPLVFVIAEVLHARFEEDPADFLSALAQDTGRWYAAHVLVLVSLVLALPAFLGIRHIVEVRRPTLASLASIAFVPGMIALAALVGMELVAWQMAQPGFDREQMIILWANISKNAGIVPMIFVALLFPIAWLLAGIGLYLTQLCPRWAAALVGLAQLVGFVSELAGGPKWLAVAAQIAFGIGLIPIGIRVLRQSGRTVGGAGGTAVANYGQLMLQAPIGASGGAPYSEEFVSRGVRSTRTYALRATSSVTTPVRSQGRRRRPRSKAPPTEPASWQSLPEALLQVLKCHAWSQRDLGLPQVEEWLTSTGI